MSNIKVNIILLILVAFFSVFVFDAFVSYKMLNVETAQMELLRTDVEVKKETLLGDLVFQYYVDLRDCFDFIAQNPELSEEKCIEEVNQSVLAEKIRKWGGSEYLETIGTEQ